MNTQESIQPAPTPWYAWVLTALVLVSLGLTIYLAASLSNTRSELAATRADLERVERGAAGSALVSAQVIDISRQLTELEPVMSSGLDEAIAELEQFGNSSLTFDVAVDEVIDINTDILIEREFSFPIDETLPLRETVETTIEVSTGLGFDIPVDVSVPVSVDVPIRLDVDVPISETVPVDVAVPLKLEIPIEVDIAGTELSSLVEELASALRTLQTTLNDLTPG